MGADARRFEPWPFALIGALAFMIAVSIAFLRVAVGNPDPLVVKDAYAAEPAVAEAPTAGRDAWMHNSARVFSLYQACYELRICQHPPRQARPGAAERPSAAGGRSVARRSGERRRAGWVQDRRPGA